jgi:phosphatidylglycerophosphatase A
MLMESSEKSNINKRDIFVFICSGAYTGFFPFAPGTFASLLFAIPLAILNYYILSAKFLALPLLVTLGIISTFSINRVQNKYKSFDPGWIVIDEIIAIILVWIFCPEIKNFEFAFPIAIGLFRLFDITKPWPASYFDRGSHRASYVILDDIVAAIYALCIVWIITFFI